MDTADLFETSLEESVDVEEEEFTPAEVLSKLEVQQSFRQAVLGAGKGTLDDFETVFHTFFQDFPHFFQDFPHFFQDFPHFFQDFPHTNQDSSHTNQVSSY